MNVMSTLYAGLDSSGMPWLQVADAVVKASILLGAAAVATLMLRKTSASVRHLIWIMALLGALAVPALSMALPRWRVPVVTMPSAAMIPASLDVTPARPAPPTIRPARPTRQADAAATTAPLTSPVHQSPAADSAARGSWLTAAAALWIAGFLFMMARLAAGMLAVAWMSRRTEVVIDAPWLPLARRLAVDLHVSPRVVFLRSPRATMPMAWGVLRPAVLMPADADEWPVERLRIVLLHELAHVRRRDCLTHLLAQAACAVYWFHPLAWMAAAGRGPNGSAPATIWSWPPARAARRMPRSSCTWPGRCALAGSRRSWPERRWRWRTVLNSKDVCSPSSTLGFRAPGCRGYAC